MNRPCLIIRRHHAAPIPAMSSGIGAGDFSEPHADNGGADWRDTILKPGRLSDADKLQRLFPQIVAQWLKDHFNGDSELIAAFFNKDERTARNWLSGLNSPSGPCAAAMIIQFPDLRQRLLEAVAA